MSAASKDRPKPSAGHPREQLEQLYRAIGIPAVAAAAHMAKRPAPAATPVREEPVFLKDEPRAA